MDQQSRENRIFIRKMIVWTLIAGITLIVIMVSVQIHKSKTAEFDRIKAEIVSCCENAGLNNTTVFIPDAKCGSEYTTYVLKINASGADNLTYYEISRLISNLKRIETTLDDTILWPEIRIDGKEYWLASYDGALYEDHKQVFGGKSYSSSSPDKGTSSGADKSDAASSKSSSKSSKTNQDNDPYNVNSYYHAEDFYYYNYDDFWDYEDAEDYYNEHRTK